MKKMSKNEAKFWIGTGTWAIIMIVMGIMNNVVLLSLHPLEYYYTLEGMKLTMALAAIEIPVTLGIGQIYIWFCVKPLSKDLNDIREVIKKMK